jgi:alkylhydroperoxidase family enzyme
LLDPAIRAAAASPGSQEALPPTQPPLAALPSAALPAAALPPALQAYVAKVCESAYRISDADLGALTEAGYSEDEIFEVTVAAAFGTALRSLDAGLRAVREGS